MTMALIILIRLVTRIVAPAAFITVIIAIAIAIAIARITVPARITISITCVFRWPNCTYAIIMANFRGCVVRKTVLNFVQIRTVHHFCTSP